MQPSDCAALFLNRPRQVTSKIELDVDVEKKIGGTKDPPTGSTQRSDPDV